MRLGRVVVASQNSDKVAEIESVLRDIDPEVEMVGGLSWPEIAETGTTLEANALLKARAVHGYTGHVAIADDTGLEVVALGGAPGVLTARFAGPDATYTENVDRLLHDLAGLNDRRASFRTAVAMVWAGSNVVVEGSLDGVITTEPRGEGGFGYDPVFEVSGVTLAEMTPASKHEVSHRARALRALSVRLGNDPRFR